MSSQEYEMTVAQPSCSSVADNRLVLHHRDYGIESAHSQTPVTNIDVRESSDVHYGSSFVSVTRNIDDTEVAKGRILGLELVSPQGSKRLRCSVAVCVCWTLVVASALIFFIFYFAITEPPIRRLDLDLQEPWYLRRSHWHAHLERSLTLLELPVSKVIIGHSSSVHDFCDDQSDCLHIVLRIQKEDQNNFRWPDIGPNFLVSGNGIVYEGRGANIEGTMVRQFDKEIISIMFLGNYAVNIPSEQQFINVNVLLQELVRKEVLTNNYELFGHCQMIGYIEPPGPNLMDMLYLFQNWNSTNNHTCTRA